MVAGLWDNDLWASHLLFFNAILCCTAMGIVALHIFLLKHPLCQWMHGGFTLMVAICLMLTGLMLAMAPPLSFPTPELLSHLRDALILRMRGTALTPREQQMVSAMLLGYKQALDPDVRTAFNAAGVSHLLALSGLHIGIIATLASALIPKKIPLRKLILSALIWCYILLVGMPVSAVRAGLMLTLWWMNPYRRQHTYTMDTVALAALILLVYRPTYLTDVGFQLSFAAVSSILLFQPSFRYSKKWPRKPQQWIWVCLAAQIGVMPLTFWYFGTFPTYFLIANLLITPVLTPCIVYGSLVLMVVACLMPQWSTLASTPLHYLFEIQWWLMQQIQQLPHAVITL